MADKNLSAEQQLLSLIEGNDKPDKPKEAKPEAAGGAPAPAKPEPKPAASAPAPASPVEPAASPLKPVALTEEEIPITKRAPPVFSADVLRGKISFTKEAFENFLKGKDFRLDEHLHLVINFLIVCVVIICALLVSEAFKGSRRFKELPELIAVKKPAAAENQVVSPVTVESLPVYLEKVNRRNIFSPKPKEVIQVERAAPISVLQTAVDNLKLVGISEDETEKYAMIEDIKTQATFFVREGEAVSGITLKQILDNKVILTDGVETAELK